MKKRQNLTLRHQPMPMGVALRTETRRELVARWLIMSWSVERIARKLGMSAKSIHRIIGTTEFERIYQDLQQQQLKHVDRRLGSLLNGAVDALERMLKHGDWRARDAAVEKILRVHGKYVEKYDITGTLDHRSQVRQVQGELVEGMSDEMRQEARELLSLQRAMLQKQIPARLTSRDPEDLDHDEDQPISGFAIPASRTNRRAGSARTAT